MKRIILLLYLACLTLSGYAQVPSEVLAAYNKVVNTFKNYEIIPEEYCSEDDYYTLQPTKIVYKHPNIQLSFTSKLEDGVWLASGDKSGTYTLVLPIASTKFDFLDYNYSSDLRISNSTGIEFIRSNGKRKIIEQYSFSGTRLTIKKLYDEMIYLQKLLIENGYKGNLGIASSTNTTTSKSICLIT